jgi:hypothetical protein
VVEDPLRGHIKHMATMICVADITRSLEQNFSKTDCGSATSWTRCARRRVGALLVATITLLAACGGSGDDRADSDQLADIDFKPDVADPAWAIGAGPRIVIDEAHSNFHTAGGRYEPFAELARSDGFVVQSNDAPFTSESLANIDILVIANAVNERNVDDWSLPTPSAFTAEEVEAVRGWVDRGGSLLLIVDHMPFSGAAAELGAAFGIEFNNGFAFGTPDEGQIIFEAASGGLGEHPIVHGRDGDESIDHVMSFAGTAFTIRAGMTREPLLVLPAGTQLLLPEVAGEFSEQTERRDASGMLQGAALDVGRGRVATFGEAGMFTAQVRGENREPVGMNHPNASDNAQFVLNVLHWLAGIH